MLYTIKEETLNDISNAVKSKLPTQEDFTVGELASKILEIPSVDNNFLSIYDAEPTVVFESQEKVPVQVTLEQANSLQGKQSMKFTPLDPLGDRDGALAGGRLYATFSSNLDLSKYDKIMVDMYISKACSSSGFQINFCSGHSNGYNDEDGFNWLFVLNDKVGWHRFIINKEDIPMVLPADWSKIIKMRLSWMNYSGDTNVYFLLDNLNAYN